MGRKEKINQVRQKLGFFDNYLKSRQDDEIPFLDPTSPNLIEKSILLIARVLLAVMALFFIGRALITTFGG